MNTAFRCVNRQNPVIRSIHPRFVSRYSLVSIGVALMLITTGSIECLAARPSIAVAPSILSGNIPPGLSRDLTGIFKGLVAQSYSPVSDERYRTASRNVFREIRAEQCTEGYCIYKIKQELAVNRLIILELAKTEDLFQLKITMVRDDDRLVEEQICKSCSVERLEQQLRNTFEAIRDQDMTDLSDMNIPREPQTLSEHFIRNRRMHVAIAGIFLVSTWGLLEEAKEHNSLSERNNELESLQQSAVTSSELSAIRAEYESNKGKMKYCSYRMNVMQFIMASMVAVELYQLSDLIDSNNKKSLVEGQSNHWYYPAIIRSVIAGDRQHTGLAMTWKW